MLTVEHSFKGLFILVDLFVLVFRTEAQHRTKKVSEQSSSERCGVETPG